MTVGLTGGVASGKSAVADAFERHGAVVVEFDELMREVLVPGHDALADLRSVFSEEIVHEDGTIDWRTLDRLTADSPSARARLYDVVTSPVEKRVARLMDERGLSREQAWAEIDADAVT